MSQVQLRRLFDEQTKRFVLLNWGPFVNELLTPPRAVVELARRVCPNDTGDIHWWENGTPGPKYVSGYTATHPICMDNFLLYMIASKTCDTKLHKKLMHQNLVAWCKQNGLDIKGQACSYLGKTVLDSSGYPKNDRNLKWASHRVRQAVDQYKSRNFGEAIQQEYHLHHFKIATPDIPLPHLHGALTRSHGSLRTLGAHFQDCDVMCDFACTVTPEVVRVVQDRYQPRIYKRCEVAMGNYLKEFQQNPESTEDRVFHIQNDESVGKNCHTFVFCIHGRVFRAKIYNKFVQTIESFSVRQSMGSHLLDWLDNKGKQLHKSISDPRTQSRGLSRIEITFYSDLPSLAEIDEYMHHVKQVLLPGCNYTSIADQWKMLTPVLKQSVYIYDCQQGILSYIRWINKHTGSCNGWSTTRYKSLAVVEKLLKSSSFHGTCVKLFLMDYQTESVQHRTSSPVTISHQGFNLNKAGLPPAKRTALLKSTWSYRRYTAWRVSLMCFTREGPFVNTLLAPNGNPGYKNPSLQHDLPSKRGLVDLPQLKLLVQSCDESNRLVALTRLHAQPSGCAMGLEYAAMDREYTCCIEKGIEARIDLKRQTRRSVDRLGQKRKRTIPKLYADLCSDAGLNEEANLDMKGSKSITCLPLGRYTLLASRPFQFRGEERTALLIKEHPDTIYHIVHDEAGVMSPKSYPIVFQLTGVTRKGHRRFAQIVLLE